MQNLDQFIRNPVGNLVEIITKNYWD